MTPDEERDRWSTARRAANRDRMVAVATAGGRPIAAPPRRPGDDDPKPHPTFVPARDLEDGSFWVIWRGATFGLVRPMTDHDGGNERWQPVDVSVPIHRAIGDLHPTRLEAGQFLVAFVFARSLSLPLPGWAR